MAVVYCDKQLATVDELLELAGNGQDYEFIEGELAMALQVERRRFTVEAFERMVDAGILAEDERVELIDGEIVQMSPISGPHMDCVNALSETLSRSILSDAIVSGQNPINLSPQSQPQPDITLIRRDKPRGIVPQVEHVLAVIEVASSSRAFDRGVKLPLYAAAGIPEAWLVDLIAGIIERHTEPVDGIYRNVVFARRGESISSTVLPSMLLVVDDILGPEVSDAAGT